jgi:hypothetical protein
MDLIIGLCFGVAAAVALVVMWRMAEHLREEVQDRENPPDEQKVRSRSKHLKMRLATHSALRSSRWNRGAISR